MAILLSQIGTWRMKLKYTRRKGGHDAATFRVPIHLTEADINNLMDAYIETFGGRRSRKTLSEALHWFANEGIISGLVNYSARDIE